MFTSEYGWDTNKILGLTLKEVSWRLSAIHDRKMQDLKTSASLHGCELKQSEQTVKAAKGSQAKLSEKEEAAITAAFNLRMKGQ